MKYLQEKITRSVVLKDAVHFWVLTCTLTTTSYHVSCALFVCYKVKMYQVLFQRNISSEAIAIWAVEADLLAYSIDSNLTLHSTPILPLLIWLFFEKGISLYPLSYGFLLIPISLLIGNHFYMSCLYQIDYFITNMPIDSMMFQRFKGKRNQRSTTTWMLILKLIEKLW